MYPVCPGSGEYAIGTPLFEKAVISFPGGKTLSVLAYGVSSARRYVRRVTLNGREIVGNFLYAADLRNGGELRFGMTNAL